MTVLSADFLCFYLQVGLSFARFAAVVAVLDDERRPGFSRMPNVTNDLHPRRAFYPELSLAIVIQILRIITARIPITYRRYLRNVKLIEFPQRERVELKNKRVYIHAGYAHAINSLGMVSTLSLFSLSGLFRRPWWLRVFLP